MFGERQSAREGWVFFLYPKKGDVESKICTSE